MTLALAAGYAICFTNIAYLAQSRCGGTAYFTITSVNTIIFLVIASFVLVFVHLIIFWEKLRTCCRNCKKKNVTAVDIAPVSEVNDESSKQKMLNDPEGTMSDGNAMNQGPSRRANDDDELEDNGPPKRGNDDDELEEAPKKKEKDDIY